MKSVERILKGRSKFKRFTVGNDHNVFLVLAGREKFVLKQYRFRTVKSVKKEAGFINFLFESGCKAPKVIDINNKLSFFWNGGPSILMEYLPGSLLIKSKLTDRLLVEMGRELGKLDKNSSLFSKKFPTEPNKNKIVNNVLKPHPLFGHNSFNKFLKLFNGLKAAAEKLMTDYENIAKILQDLPRILIHNDVSEKNIIVNKNELSGFIDFSDFIKAPAIINLATASAHLCFRDDNWRTNLEIFINSYQSEFPLAYWREKFDLMPFLMRYRLLSEMATNFYLGTVTKKARNTEFTNRILWDKLKTLMTIPESSIYEVINGYC